MIRIYLTSLVLFLSLPLIAQLPIRRELNDNWQFTQSGLNEWLPATVPGTVHTDLMANEKISDPYYRTAERDVQWIDKVGWDYRTTFDADPSWMNAERVELVFDGLDTYATVYLNGTQILKADNMFLAWRVDIRPHLKVRGNELLVHFDSPVTVGLQKQAEYGLRLPANNDQSETGQTGPNKVSVFTRKAGYHYGWDWGPRLVPSGIWRPVRIEAWSRMRIDDVYVATIALTGRSAKMQADVTYVAEKAGKGSLVIQAGPDIWVNMNAEWTTGVNKISREFVIVNPKLWWPAGYGDQPIYSLICRITGSDGSSAEYPFKTGVRTIRLKQDPDPDGNGKSFQFVINGVPVFARGANYIPSDVFLPRLTPADYRTVIESAAFANMNMLRVWGGGIYENDIFYDLCDEHGILVWQDFMFACSMYPGTPDFLSSIAEEARQNIIRIRKHPSLALWCGNNEIEAAWGPYNDAAGWGWKQRYSEPQREIIWQAYDTIFHRILPAAVEALTPSIAYWHSSPSAGMGQMATNETRTGDNHYWGVWHQKHPFEDYNKYISRFMSEYGFQSFPEYDAVKKYTVPEDEDIESPVMSSHQRSGIGNLRIREYMTVDYTVPEKFEDFLYVSHLLQAEGIKTAIEAHRRNKPYCMGTLYWQLNDCWPVASWSSTDFYRNYKALHYFVRKAFEPVVVLPVLNDKDVEFRIVSDHRELLTGRLSIRTLSLDGKVLFEQIVPVSVDPLSNTAAARIPLNQLTNGHPASGLVIQSSVTTGDLPVTSNQLYLVRPKELQLTKPAINYIVGEEGTDWIISIKADRVVKNLMITFDGRAGIFSDNYFDLLPGETAVIKLAKKWSAANPAGKIKIKSLVDTY
jgi:beta-mannosidase